MYKSPSTDQIPAELVQAGGKTFTLRYTNLLILFGIRKKLPWQWNESITVHIYKEDNLKLTYNYTGISVLLTTYKILYNILLFSITPHACDITGDY
jgi:hypothetical protein